MRRIWKFAVQAEGYVITSQNHYKQANKPKPTTHFEQNKPNANTQHKNSKTNKKINPARPQLRGQEGSCESEFKRICTESEGEVEVEFASAFRGEFESEFESEFEGEFESEFAADFEGEFKVEFDGELEGRFQNANRNTNVKTN